MQFDKGELGYSIDRHEEIEPALFGASLCDVDVKEAERVGLGLPLSGAGFATVIPSELDRLLREVAEGPDH